MNWNNSLFLKTTSESIYLLWKEFFYTFSSVFLSRKINISLEVSLSSMLSRISYWEKLVGNEILVVFVSNNVRTVDLSFHYSIALLFFITLYYNYYSNRLRFLKMKRHEWVAVLLSTNNMNMLFLFNYTWKFLCQDLRWFIDLLK